MARVAGLGGRRSVADARFVGAGRGVRRIWRRGRSADRRYRSGLRFALQGLRSPEEERSAAAFCCERPCCSPPEAAPLRTDRPRHRRGRRTPSGPRLCGRKFAECRRRRRSGTLRAGKRGFEGARNRAFNRLSVKPIALSKKIIKNFRNFGCYFFHRCKTFVTFVPFGS